MLEKEIKILDVDVVRICQQLHLAGAVLTFIGVIHDVYYDFSDHAEEKLKTSGRMFRLRHKGMVHMYTIKNKRRDISKKEKLIAKDEYEQEITDIDSFQRVIQKYGMKRIREKKKYRISYQLGQITFDIDDYQNGIPPLLEIEAPKKKHIKQWRKKLGLKTHVVLLGGSQKLFRYYNIPYMR